MSANDKHWEGCTICARDDGHADDCPTITNLWPISEPVQCHQCKEWKSEGVYRKIPTLPEDNDLASLDMPFWWEPGTKIVCGDCARLRIVPALLHDMHMEKMKRDGVFWYRSSCNCSWESDWNVYRWVSEDAYKGHLDEQDG